MKRSILVATFLVTAAGVASANLLTTTTSPQNPTPPLPQAQPATPAPVTAKTARAEPAAPAAAPTASPKALAPVIQKTTLEARQAPVPFQMKSRPAVNLPKVEAKAEDKPGETPADATTDGFNEKAAKAAIEADGYKSVKVLRKGTNGVWHASGLRGSTTVMLTVDASGSVRAD
jgi:hypothetical protein